MFAITRTPRILIKLKSTPNLSAFKFNNNQLNVSFQPLFEHIQSGVNTFAETSTSQWYTMTSNQSRQETNAWDLCHHLVQNGFGITGMEAAEFAEPDLEQQWVVGKSTEHAFAAGIDCRNAAPQDKKPPLVALSDDFWYQDKLHSQLKDAHNTIGEPTDKIRIAHLDTGYDPAHKTLPKFLRRDLQRNFIDGETANDATDHTSGLFTNLGHGCGTLSILAGNGIGAAPSVEVVPIRVANSVVLFKNSAIAKALDYVYGLYQNPQTRVHVITMSMGGLPSQAWAEAVNALYELGVFIVTAAGNNFGNMPTHNIVYPARFKRVIAACGVMANSKPYADLPLNIMAGNYGPASKMLTAMAAYTPNIPWAILGCSNLVDHDGRGTSSATPQIAATAALWIQKYKTEWEQYTEGWMRVEAVRQALFVSASSPNTEDSKYFGRGIIRANEALSKRPVAAQHLEKQSTDSASFPFLRVITGLGLSETQDVRQRMLELEALQISQRSKEIGLLLADPEHPEQLSPSEKQRILDLLRESPGVSKTLREYLDNHSASPPQFLQQEVVPQHISQKDMARLAMALNPPMPKLLTRKLRVFAYDPLLSNKPDFIHINQTVSEVVWEDNLQPGPVGEYIEVVDVDPASECAYAPVDLNHTAILSSAGLSPSESDPRFHQQMVYAVAMKTIQHFERALGRVALWSPRFVKYEKNGEKCVERHFVQRLRIYPHALREANSYYSPIKKSLLFGYFSASNTNPGENLPGGTVFCCLSHDVVAHETTHALLDGLHRYFSEPSNEDVFAFHEAFADIVALFQHFTVPEALVDQIAKTRGDLSQHNLLADLAYQFGQGIGMHGSLRSAIGHTDKKTGKWKAKLPKASDYQEATEAHDKGAVLVAAVFDAFLDIYRRRSQDLIRLATGGSGVLPDGYIGNDLVNRLANEASKTAGHLLNICIRALDYCPPVDIRFGEYLRAIITADRDLVPNDPWCYRAAIIQGFRLRGIYPDNVRNLSSNSLCWEDPELSKDMTEKLGLKEILSQLQLNWDLRHSRKEVDKISLHNCKLIHTWLKSKNKVSNEDIEALGIYRDLDKLPPNLTKSMGELRPFEVHSVRPARRIGPDGQQLTDLIVEITQSWLPKEGGKYRGGCTLIIDLETYSLRYVIRKRVGNLKRIESQDMYRLSLVQNNLAANYIDESALNREPFAMVHRAN